MDHITLFITLTLLFAFFIESIFGFAGSVISLAILGYYVDIKTLTSIILFVATIASISVVLTDRKSFNKKQYLQMIALAIPGAIIGVILFDQLTSDILLKVLAILLLIMAFSSYYEPYLSKGSKSVLLLLSGIAHGIFGLGGIVAVGTMKNRFASKSQLRVTFAIFFISLNLIRAIQFSIQGSLVSSVIIDLWWIPVPMLLTIWLGHKVHLNISEVFFKKGISVLLLISGIFLLLK